ncbi:MAG: hypothetical protein J7L88_02620 [Thermoplasmata archaeon]|nr:hypothetical protein [Thermoplasmata archaeon]
MVRLKSDEKALEKSLLSEDIITRQSISIREGEALGKEGGVEYILVEGSEEAVERVKEIAPNNILEGKEAEEIYNKIKAEEENAVSGMGFVFQ